MQCNNCCHKVICKHYTYVLENFLIGIQINNCKLYESEIQNTIHKKDQLVSNPITTDRDFTAGYADFSSLSNKTKISAIPVEINKVVCDRCKTEVHSTDIDNCIECGRAICVDCSVNTFDIESGQQIVTCEKCWSGTPDPTPGNEKEVKISYSTDKKDDVWSLTDFTDNKEEVKEDVKSESVDNKSSNRKSKKK